MKVMFVSFGLFSGPEHELKENHGLPGLNGWKFWSAFKAVPQSRDRRTPKQRVCGSRTFLIRDIRVIRGCLLSANSCSLVSIRG